MAHMVKRLTLSEKMNGTNYEDIMDKHLGESKKLKELGTKFESEKNALESRIEKIHGINVSEDKKAALINEIKAKITELQQQYDQDVTQEQQRIEQELDDDMDDMSDAISDLNAEEAEFKKMKMEAATDVDAASVGDSISKESQSLQQLQNETKQKMDEQKKLLAEQLNRIKNKPV